MIVGMNDNRDHAQLVAAELITVVDQARWDARISSVRELARLAGMTHTSLNKRMTGQVVFNVRDLAALGGALGVSPAELLRRAIEAAGTDADFPGVSDEPSSLEHLKGLPSAAAPKRRDTGEGDDDA